MFFNERRCFVFFVELGRVCVVFVEGCVKMERGVLILEDVCEGFLRERGNIGIKRLGI